MKLTDKQIEWWAQCSRNAEVRAMAQELIGHRAAQEALRKVAAQLAPNKQ